MSKSTDERGRIYLPKEVRDRFGDEYRIVEFPSHIALFPVDEEPLEGLRAAVGDAFEGADADEWKERARERVSEDVIDESDRDGDED